MQKEETHIKISHTLNEKILMIILFNVTFTFYDNMTYYKIYSFFLKIKTIHHIHVAHLVKF